MLHTSHFKSHHGCGEQPSNWSIKVYVSYTSRKYGEETATQGSKNQETPENRTGELTWQPPQDLLVKFLILN